MLWWELWLGFSVVCGFRFHVRVTLVDAFRASLGLEEDLLLSLD